MGQKPLQIVRSIGHDVPWGLADDLAGEEERASETRCPSSSPNSWELCSMNGIMPEPPALSSRRSPRGRSRAAEPAEHGSSPRGALQPDGLSAARESPGGRIWPLPPRAPAVRGGRYR